KDKIRDLYVHGVQTCALAISGRRGPRLLRRRGFRVEPEEVEAALAALPGVAAAVVAVRPDLAGDARLVGYAVPAEGADASPARLRDLLAERLPAAMVPAAVVPMEALPTLPNGKVDRSALPEPDFAA